MCLGASWPQLQHAEKSNAWQAFSSSDYEAVIVTVSVQRWGWWMVISVYDGCQAASSSYCVVLNHMYPSETGLSFIALTKTSVF